MMLQSLHQWKAPALLRMLFGVSVGLSFFVAFLLRILGSQMYPFFILIYIWTAIYTVSMTLLVRISRMSSSSLLTGWRSFSILGLVTFAIRLTFIGLDSHISLDSLWYLDFGKFMLAGNLPYYQFYFPYPPVFAYFIFIIATIAPSVDSFRILASILDIGVVLLIWKIASQRSDPLLKSVGPIAYALLPISIIESGLNGHFEPLVNVFLLLSILLILRGRVGLSGCSLGLAIATKAYPLLLFPIGLFYLQGWKERIKFVLATMISAAATFLPFFLLSFAVPSVPTSGSSEATSGFIQLAISSLIALGPDRILTTIFGIVGISLGLIIVIRQSMKKDDTLNRGHYYWASLVMAAVLIAMGFIAGVYPLLPSSKVVYWRYPIDIGLVRMITTVSLGLLVLFYSIKGIQGKRAYRPSSASVLLLISFTILLISSLIRDVFYGWYLLWAIPFLLLMNDKKLILTVLLCLLLLYPSYTNDNFSSLGFDESRSWEENFGNLEDWSSSLLINNQSTSSTDVVWNASSQDSQGYFSFDTTALGSAIPIENISIRFAKTVDLHFSSSTDVVARMKATWDPTFGPVAYMSLNFTGVSNEGLPINGSIIPLTGLFTNLTYILWRFSFSAWNSSIDGGVVDQLRLAIYPQSRTVAGYLISSLYATDSMLFNPIYYVVVPALIAISLGAFVILKSELDFLEIEEVNSVNRSE